jgi:hypothetical protein
MKRATREQCIFVFVEGECEANTVAGLLFDDVEFESLGIQIANYNGRGNLPTMLTFLRQTLSFDRPIILTYDNDPESLKSMETCRKRNLINELVYPFPIPNEAVVTYPCGHGGGSFEESFSIDEFLSAVFHESVMPKRIRSQFMEFRSMFDGSKPWSRQLQKFCADRGFPKIREKKVRVAELLATNISEQPTTYVALAKLIREVRAKHPVKHPDDVVLPKVHGLTA